MPEDAMPLYYFDIKDGQDFPDPEGSEWPDLQAARIEAVRLSAEVLREMPERFWHCEEWTMSVSDEDGHPLFTLTFKATSATPGSPDHLSHAALAEAASRRGPVGSA